MLLLLLLLLSACSGILGIEEATLDEGVQNAIERQMCVLTSDCQDDQVCIFRVCSPPCASDRDCDDGFGCLSTDEGVACVEPSDSDCDRDDDCPDGTRCADGACRTPCNAQGEGCLEGQTCIDLACRSPRLDGEDLPGLDAGTDAGSIANNDAGALDAGGDATVADAGPDSGLPPTAECEPREKHCEDGTLYTCRSDETWDQGTPCAYVCIGGECTGDCVPQDRHCMEESLQSCTDEGVWDEIQACPRVCTVEGCVDRCETGTRQCNDNELLTCTNAGEFDHFMDCDYVCRSGACVGECVPEDVTCNGNATEVCSADGEWIEGTPCEFDCVGDECVGECMPDDTRCEPGGTGAMQTCGTNFMWGAPDACDFYCDDTTGACEGECDPTDTRCQSGSDTGIETCGGNFTWGNATQCDHVCLDSSGMCGGICDPGQKQCLAGSDTVRQTCSALGEWGSNFTCQFVCVDATGECGGSCVPNAVSCNNVAPSTSQVMTCSSAGAPAVTQTCTYPTQLCESGACVANAFYDRGYAAQLPSSSSAAASYLFAIPVTIDRRVRVDSFGLYGRARAGVHVKMVLYADNGSGMPGAFIASSDQADLVTGTMTLAIQAATTINAGTYWVAAIYDGVGGNTYIRTGASALGSLVYVAHDYATAYPATFPSGGVAVPQNDYNHFLHVRNSL